MLKETLWQEIDTLPESQLNSLWEFIQFLRYKAEGKPETSIVSKRIEGLDAGTTWISDDFNEPLPDSFWLGKDASDEAIT